MDQVVVAMSVGVYMENMMRGGKIEMYRWPGGGEGKEFPPTFLASGSFFQCDLIVRICFLFAGASSSHITHATR